LWLPTMGRGEKKDFNRKKGGIFVPVKKRKTWVLQNKGGGAQNPPADHQTPKGTHLTDKRSIRKAGEKVRV